MLHPPLCWVDWKQTQPSHEEMVTKSIPSNEHRNIYQQSRYFCIVLSPIPGTEASIKTLNYASLLFLHPWCGFAGAWLAGSRGCCCFVRFILAATGTDGATLQKGMHPGRQKKSANWSLNKILQTLPNAFFLGNLIMCKWYLLRTY